MKKPQLVKQGVSLRHKVKFHFIINNLSPLLVHFAPGNISYHSRGKFIYLPNQTKNNLMYSHVRNQYISNRFILHLVWVM